MYYPHTFILNRYYLFEIPKRERERELKCYFKISLIQLLIILDLNIISIILLQIVFKSVSQGKYYYRYFILI